MKTPSKFKKIIASAIFLSISASTLNAAGAGGSGMSAPLELGCKIYMCLQGGQGFAECQAPLQTYYSLTSNPYTKAYGESLPASCVASFLK